METIPVAWTYAFDYSFSNNSNNVTFKVLKYFLYNTI